MTKLREKNVNTIKPPKKILCNFFTVERCEFNFLATLLAFVYKRVDILNGYRLKIKKCR